MTDWNDPAVRKADHDQYRAAVRKAQRGRAVGSPFKTFDGALKRARFEAGQDKDRKYIFSVQGEDGQFRVRKIKRT